MSPVTRALLFQGLKDDRTAEKILLPFARRLKTGNPAATIDRLFESRHVYDLRLIVAIGTTVALWVITIAVLTGIVAGYLDWKIQTGSGGHSGLTGPHAIAHAAFAGGTALLELAGPTVIGMYGLLTWAYQTGNSRLGIVDLFACEIDTICRVITVTDMVQNQINNSHARMVAPASHAFDSQESYFPILETSGSELQKLEARVVSNITSFYTFMKAVRDSLRQLPDTRLAQPMQPLAQAGREPDQCAAELVNRRSQALRNMLYTLYLALESGRRATADLVEFEPDYTERTIVVLISELTAYQFLREQFTMPREMRHDRLALRQTEYRELVRALRSQVQKHKSEFLHLAPTASADDHAHATQWRAAYQLLHELDARYARLGNSATRCECADDTSVQA